jgi:DNA-binding transcriptional ArsR family regulator
VGDDIRTPSIARNPVSPSRKSAKGEKSSAAWRTKTLTTIDQLRCLADPLRLRILSIFAERPHTTKQVADLLGEKPTRLYHHVESLLRAGVIELTETRPNRGTVERYYRAVANQFAVADSLLALETTGSSAPGPVSKIAASILDSTRDDLARLAEEGMESSPDNLPIVARAIVTGTPREIRAIRSKLTALLESKGKAKGEDGSKDNPDALVYGLTIAFYPIKK